MRHIPISNVQLSLYGTKQEQAVTRPPDRCHLFKIIRLFSVSVSHLPVSVLFT